jgi:hypothetical protein
MREEYKEYESSTKGVQGSATEYKQLRVGGSAMECYSAGHGSWRIFIAKIRYQETSCENTADE